METIQVKELVRQCVQCDFNFVQDFKETLQCLCPTCRKKMDERLYPVDDKPTEEPKIIYLPFIPSVEQVLKKL